MTTAHDAALQYYNARAGWRHLWASARWSMRFSRLCQDRIGRSRPIDAEALQHIFRRCGA